MLICPVPFDFSLISSVLNLKINCLVQGDNPRSAFTVGIANTENVSALKQAIRKGKEPAFDHVPADTLVLWKVSIPTDSLVNQDPRIRDLDKDHSLLPTNRLSKVFSDALQEEHIHVVVRAPNHGEPEFFVLAARQALSRLHTARTANDIDGKVLLRPDDEQLKSIGIESLGKRMHTIDELRPGGKYSLLVTSTTH
jgi:hypothetical protein